MKNLIFRGALIYKKVYHPPIVNIFILKKIKNFFKKLNLYWAPEDYAPLYCKDDLIKDLTFTNIRREMIFAVVLIIISIGCLILDYRNYEQDLWYLMPGYRLLFYMHLALLAVSVLFILLLQVRKIDSPHNIGPYHKILSLGFVIFIMLWGSGISMVDQLIHQEITAYIITVFGVASVINMRTRTSIALFIAALAVVLYGVTMFQADPHKIKGYYLNLTNVTVLAWFLARILYVGYCRDFTNRRIIEKQKETLARHSKEDFLTGLFNRRYMALLLSQEFARACRYNLHLSVAMADIDFFKRVNDSYSHQTGDEVLKTIALVFKKNLRPFDIVARFGGEEFVIILPETHLDEAYTVCERIRTAVEEYPWHILHPDLKLTISFGISNDLSSGNYEKLLAVADSKLYQAKNEGRNKVLC